MWGGEETESLPAQVFGMCGSIAKIVIFNRQGKDQV